MYRHYQINPFHAIIGIFLFIFFLAISFQLAKGIFTMLMYITPILLVATLILDYKTLINYGKWLIAKFEKNILSGITWSLISFFGFPIVAAILFFKALLKKRLKSAQNQWEENHGEYVDYEEIEEEIETIEYHEKK